jgi:F-type H+-transporting ATPase subunit b
MNLHRIETRTLPARNRISRLLLPTVVILLCSGVAFASGGGERSQAEIIKEMIYQAANLALLLGVIVYFGRKPISEFFETRRSGIQSELSQAAELLAEAEHRNADLQRRLVDLSTEVEGIKDAAGRRAEDEAARILDDARAAASRIRSDAQAAISQELRRAQSELREEAADLALELATRKLTEEVVDSDRERLVDEFILRVEPTGSPRPDSSRSDSEGANR